jgi:hypothetical protein
VLVILPKAAKMRNAKSDKSQIFYRLASPQLWSVLEAERDIAHEKTLSVSLDEFFVIASVCVGNAVILVCGLHIIVGKTNLSSIFYSQQFSAAAQSSKSPLIEYVITFE